MTKIRARLFSESTGSSQLEYTAESIDGKKKYVIEGIFAQAEKPNRNKRRYPREVLFETVENYIDQKVSKKLAYGELDHPPERVQVKMSDMSHLITELWFEGDNVMGKATIADTPKGRIAMAAMDIGGQISVSTRGLGQSKPERSTGLEVMEMFHMTAIDIVSFPSGIDCFPRGFNESLEFLVEEGHMTKVEAHKIIRETDTRVSAAEFSKALKHIMKGL
ncbi:prohead assembly (scaffolding) protein [Agrobacterium phage OLIVR5]|uniref:Prohead assembly (Scaffolding) protein n=1 Tax=Agrobacterium phage OLIVR5 TaxID=2723773 RepID=A0A858MSY2_9CAUD|nr:prohead assembly (scaffolding) protein [Agrobacterium phage OLIVR5]QIW87842.1 prohead assembly (scaffolding) protein [Agrobacterium phage OLIVR5]QIW88107.1 prohead assembly (scaffolding) protein [Agrobacterium phage OLIVR6]